MAIAKKLSGSGNKVIINGRNNERLQSALNELDHAIALQGDLSVEADRISIAKELSENHPDLNIIINNAGVAHLNDLADQDNNTVDKAFQEMNTNYLSVIHFTPLLLPHLLEKKEAAIVNVTSIVAFRSNKYLPTYAASKAALHSYTQGLRDSFAENNRLGIYEVYPPLVNTEFSAEIGGANGIPPSEVAEELFIALEKNQFEVPVGDSKRIQHGIESLAINY